MCEWFRLGIFGRSAPAGASHMPGSWPTYSVWERPPGLTRVTKSFPSILHLLSSTGWLVPACSECRWGPVGAGEAPAFCTTGQCRSRDCPWLGWVASGVGGEGVAFEFRTSRQQPKFFYFTSFSWTPLTKHFFYIILGFLFVCFTILGFSPKLIVVLLCFEGELFRKT